MEAFFQTGMIGSEGRRGAAGENPASEKRRSKHVMQSALQMELVLHNGVQVDMVTNVGLGQRIGLLCCSQMGVRSEIWPWPCQRLRYMLK